MDAVCIFTTVHDPRSLRRTTVIYRSGSVCWILRAYHSWSNTMSNDLVILSKSELLAQIEAAYLVCSRKALDEFINKAQLVNSEVVGYALINENTSRCEHITRQVVPKMDGSHNKYKPVYLSPQPAIPEGFMLVPIEPTDLMLNEAADVMKFHWETSNSLQFNARDIYKSMLSKIKKGC